jgi:PAS domain S-box-containing protein
MPLRGFDEEAALRAILEGTATETGERFFSVLVENVAKALNTQGAWVTEYLKESRRLRSLAFWWGGQWVHGYEYPIAGTPCEPVIHEARLVHIPENVIALYPGDNDLKKFSAVSYMGVPLMDVDGAILGHLAVLDTRPMPEEPRALALFRIFAARATAELQRLRAEAEVREREEKLSRLIDSAMDAVVELDHDLKLTRVNAAAEKLFGVAAPQAIGQDFTRFLAEESRATLSRLIQELGSRPGGQRHLWIPSGLHARRADGEAFPAEASLSRFEMHRQVFYALILRNVHERLAAEQKIRSLTDEAEYLREEIRLLGHFDEIIGQSSAMRRVLADVAQVANTGATVLIFGETGTGKELVARAIHAASGRADAPLIVVNCAAIPAALIESEFFGHEKGAFTGATQRREGRFALADGGTIFLDEVGELPLDLQAKLLRVLQEGEFEPVGSSKTRKVDVRVVAATNRDLGQAVREGKFREDLYYRLNVFPIFVPPLRERGEDIVLLASTFVKRFAQRMGRAITPVSPEDIRRLQGYSWPGNVRELQNLIERAVITARGGRMNLDRALPETSGPTAAETPDSPEHPAERIWTAKEVDGLERQNIVRALEASGWRVAGERGAARLLGMNASTLASRMKALGIKRPR